MTHTAILQPVDPENHQNMTEYKKVYSRIQELLNDLKQKERNITFHEFLQRLNVSEEVYIMALRSALKKKQKF